MHERIYELPDEARHLVQSIEAVLAEAQTLLHAQDAPPELTYTVRETGARYLPDTVAAFLAVPRSRREIPAEDGKTANDLLLEQLSVLYRSAQQTLTALSAHARELARCALPRDALRRSLDRDNAGRRRAAAPAVTDATLPTWFLQDERPVDIVARVATLLRAHFPSFTTIRRGGVLGIGAVEAIDVTLPQGRGTAFRYTLSARDGMLETTVTKLMHGTSIKSVVCTPHEWLQSLYDDIAEYTKRHQEMRTAFASLFSR